MNVPKPILTCAPVSETTGGQEEKLEEFFVREIKQIKGDLFRIAVSILHHQTDAEDALSESIVKAYAKRRTLRKRKCFKQWMMKILVRECYTLRKAGGNMIYTDTLPERAEDTEQSAAHELWDVVNRLPKEFRAVTVLFYYEDMGTKEIAKLLRISEGTVKSRLFRARSRMKTLLDMDKQPGGK